MSLLDSFSKIGTSASWIALRQMVYFWVFQVSSFLVMAVVWQATRMCKYKIYLQISTLQAWPRCLNSLRRCKASVKHWLREIKACLGVLKVDSLTSTGRGLQYTCMEVPHTHPQKMFAMYKDPPSTIYYVLYWSWAFCKLVNNLTWAHYSYLISDVCLATNWMSSVPDNIPLAEAVYKIFSP